MEHFHTIQGEGHHAGKAAYFIRIAGCDVGCPWCDVKESWDDQYPKASVQTMIEWVKESGAKNVVITGGEPSLYDLSELTQQFRTAGFNLWLETSGAYELTGEWDWVVLSPKRRKQPHPSNWNKVDEFKVVVVRPPDLEWASNLAENLPDSAAWYLQPEWSREEEVLPRIINFVKENPDWSISLQTHKYMRIP
ncbi:radical SAM protein [bacterium SCSIO 12741]|nr:radical SAM protein [bacterium SCSIO 12741]